MTDQKSVVNRKPAPQPTRRRVLSVMAVIFAAGCLSELVSFGYLLTSTGKPSYWTALQDQRGSIIETRSSDTLTASAQQPGNAGDQVVIHPYLGFTRDPRRDRSVNEYGFPGGPTSPIQRRSSSTVIIGVVGGDMADQFFREGLPRVTTALKKTTSFENKQFVFVNLACRGYKQPQQLMVVNYMLALGAEFDIIINIDGFNEVALHETENAIKNVSPIYPRNWYLLNSNIPDLYLRQLIGHQEYLESEMALLASSMSKTPLRYSATWNAVWRVRHLSLMDDRNNVVDKIRTYTTKTKEKVPFWITGPKLNESPEYDGQTNRMVWAECSLQLHVLCRENGIRYYHFLQPSQYVAGSKPMGPEERAAALIENHPYQKNAVNGYRGLVAAGKRFTGLGVRFTDLTQVFADVPKPLYLDASGRLAKEGHEMIAEDVAAAILDTES